MAYFFIFYRNTKRNNWIILLHPHLILQEKNIIVILSIIICDFNIFSILRFNPNGIYNYYCHICEYIFQIAS